jgi:hypothetical protein
MLPLPKTLVENFFAHPYANGYYSRPKETVSSSDLIRTHSGRMRQQKLYENEIDWIRKNITQLAIDAIDPPIDESISSPGEPTSMAMKRDMFKSK